MTANFLIGLLLFAFLAAMIFLSWFVREEENRDWSAEAYEDELERRETKERGGKSPRSG